MGNSPDNPLTTVPAAPIVGVNLAGLQSAACWLMVGLLLGLWLAKTKRL
jgi:hypothetical protein